MDEIKICRDTKNIISINPNENALFGMDVEQLLDSLPEEPLFDLVVTSPPYNIGKEYEKKTSIEEYSLLIRAIQDTFK